MAQEKNMPTQGRSKPQDQQDSNFKEQDQKQGPGRNLDTIQDEQDRQDQQKIRDPQRKEDQDTRR